MSEAMMTDIETVRGYLQYQACPIDHDLPETDELYLPPVPVDQAFDALSRLERVVEAAKLVVESGAIIFVGASERVERYDNLREALGALDG